MNEIKISAVRSGMANPNLESFAERWGWAPNVAVFLLVFVTSYIDRQVLSIVVGPVKASLGLGDFEIGLLQGFAFSLVLSIAAVLTSPLIDRGNRVHILAKCIVAWCVMTILCGFSTNFATLLIARTGLALAEGIVPMAVVSIICDLAPARLVPRASALFMAAPFLGSGAALLLGGPALTILDAYKDIPIPLVGQFEPWRGLFWSLGLIGLGLGLGLPWLVREPVRRSTGIETDSTLSVLPFLHIHLKFVTILFASTSMFLVAAYTVYAWMPTYMIRMQGISPSQAGLSVGSIFIIAGIGGCVFGSWIMGRGTTGYEMSHVVRMMFRLQLGMWPPLIMLPFAPTPSIALTLLGIEFFLMAAGLSSAITPAALFAPPALRGRILAVAGLTNSVIGGLGPMAVGAINDFVLGTPDRIDLSLAVTFASACMVGISIGPLALRLAIDFDKRRILAAEPNAFRPQEL